MSAKVIKKSSQEAEPLTETIWYLNDERGRSDQWNKSDISDNLLYDSENVKLLNSFKEINEGHPSMVLCHEYRRIVVEDARWLNKEGIFHREGGPAFIR